MSFNNNIQIFIYSFSLYLSIFHCNITQILPPVSTHPQIAISAAINLVICYKYSLAWIRIPFELKAFCKIYLNIALSKIECFKPRLKKKEYKLSTASSCATWENICGINVFISRLLWLWTRAPKKNRFRKRSSDVQLKRFRSVLYSDKKTSW